MNKGTQGGKKPLSSKPQVGPLFEALDFSGNQLALNKKFIASLAQAGFDVRWISSVKLTQLNNYHKRGWKVFNHSDFKSVTLEIDSDLFGESPDGTITRQEMILAIRPMEFTKQHRAHITAKTLRQERKQSQDANAIRAIGKKSRVDVVVHEGYDDND